MSATQPPSPPVLNPLSGTTIDTAPESLGLSVVNDQADSPPRVGSVSHKENTSHRNVVARAVEHTAAKLNARRSSVSPKTSTRSSLSGLSRLSLSRRKDKGKELDPDSTNSPDSSVVEEDKRMQSDVKSTLVSPPLNASMASSGDDSPFIRPQSPASSAMTSTSRPSIEILKGFGSMRAGTQTLIQALQAMPWEDGIGDDDNTGVSTAAPIDVNVAEEPGSENRLLASSIRAIHRPLARSRRQDTPQALRGPASRSSGYFSPISDEEDSSMSDGGDFEATPNESIVKSPLSESPVDAEGTTAATPTIHASKRFAMSRTASLATVRLKRRAKLAEKLKEIFGLVSIQEVLSELPCWLLSSVLLQGYIYLTNSHLCFFAHMPVRKDQVLKSGSLSKKTQRTKRWVKHWFILKNDALSWYQSSSDPYFPHGVIDLRYAISCEAVNEKEFQVRTTQKIVHLLVDSVPSRDEWVKAIRKVMFKAQNLGDTVKIAIPYSVVLDVDKSSAMDFSETIEVKVVDREDGSVDSYFFAYFHNISAALDQIRDAVRAYINVYPRAGHSTDVVHDTTVQKATPPGTSAQSESSTGTSTDTSRNRYSSRIASLLKPFSSDSSSTTTSLPTNSSASGKEKSSLSNTNSLPNSMGPSSSSLSTITDASPQARGVSDILTTPYRVASDIHTYPPAPLNAIAHSETRDSSISLWSVPTWLKTSSKRLSIHLPLVNSGVAVGEGQISEVVSSGPSNSQSTVPEMGFSILETGEAADSDMVIKFRTAFAFDEEEILLGYFPGYLFRLLPTYGRLYISTNYFCFKSGGPLVSKTKMILPLQDIQAIEKAKAYRFGQHGLVVIIKGHEELFFEFSSIDRRKAFVTLLEQRIEDTRKRISSGALPPARGKKEALILQDLEPLSMIHDEEEPRPPPENLTDSLPAVMFTSKSSTFLTFKPQQSLRFTFLTIGSRGDVQPYIALGKGLIADGHKVKIATHGEFKEWIEAHGIEFGYVGGDPAELMRICVENGTFTVSFLKEGVQKFRGWIDDLLKTAWEACQDSDVLIESPSAMAGIHIAEALKIPYFRAFTMTWTRTRAYPHAFAVPEHRMGGGYNYMSYVMFDQVFWRGTAGQINRWRRNVLKLDSTSLDRMEPHKVPFLYNFSPHAVPPPLDWPEWIRITGYWFLDDAEVGSKKWSPPDTLTQFLEEARSNGKKVVYIGFGSIVVSDPESMTRCVVEAVVRSGVYAVLSKGWSDRLHIKKASEATEPEVPLPPQIYQIASIPHDWLFQRVDAACHHGGAGTTGASLRAGIPTIIKPFFGDQFFWGDRVEALGIGSSVRKLTVENLTEALILATTDEKQIARAKLIGEQIRAENGVGTAIEAIYRDLEYARSLIKSMHEDKSSDEEGATIRGLHKRRISSRSTSGRNHSAESGGNSHGAPSEDWSVISDQDERRVSRPNSEYLDRDGTSKRSNIAAAVFSVLPDVLTHSKSHSRTQTQ